MKPIAENRYTLTRRLFCEGMGYVVRRSYAQTANRGLIALMIALAALAAATLLLKLSPGLVFIEAFFVLAAAVWIKVYLPRAKARAAWKQLTRKYGDRMERTTCFYFDRLTVQTADRETRVKYSDIDEILTTGNLLILVASDRTGIMVKRDAYVTGSEEDALSAISRVQKM